MIQLTRNLLSAAIAATLTFAGTAAAAPPRMPVQGVLTSAQGDPIVGELPVRFALYAAAEGGVALWEEAQAVDFDAGFFTANLGVVEPLDPALIAQNDALWLGIAVDDDVEMARIELGTAPFAAFAVFAGDADRLGGQAAESFAASVHRHDWDDLDGVPADLADGDDDTTYRATPGGGLDLVDGGFALLSGCDEGQILRREAGGWACAVDASGAAIAAFDLDGTVLGITEGEATWTVDLAALATDLDPSNELLSGFALAGSTLQIVDAGGVYAVDLAALVDDADADPLNETNTDLAFDGATLTLTDAAGALSADLSALVDDADADPNNETNTALAFEGATLTLTDAAGALSADLSALVDDADADPNNEMNTALAFDGATLTLTDAAGALSADLSALVDDADADPNNETNTALAFDGATLTLTDAAGALSADLSALVDDADADPNNETNTALAFDGATLTLTDAAGALSVDLSALAQTLTLNGTDLTLSDGNTVALDAVQDDLGDHVATRNLALSGFWVSNDGADAGLFVDGGGNVGVGTASPQSTLDVRGDVRVAQALVAQANAARASAIDASNTSVNRVYQPNANTRIWQSFTAESTGGFVQLQVHLDNSPVAGGVLEIYEGEGTGGALLLEQAFVDEGTGRRTIVLDSPVAIVEGSQYTIRLTNTADVWEWRFNNSNVYDGGRASTSANEDLDFRVYVTGDPVLVGVGDSGAITVADGAITVDGDGQVGIGTAAPAYALQVGEAGDGTEARANGWNIFSDARFKTDVQPIEDPLARLMAIGGYTYVWKGGKDKAREAGVIAQEVEAVLPEVVTIDAQGYRAVDYGKLSPLLIEGLKAQQRMIEAQQEALEALRAENAEIRAALGLQ